MDRVGRYIMEGVFQFDLPRLQSFTMGFMSFEGDFRKERRIRTEEPFLVKNSLVMKSESEFISMNRSPFAE